jgi:hypothetical protein
MDSLVLATLLLKTMKAFLRKEPLQDQVVIVYRKIETFEGSWEIGYLFAKKECFDEIKQTKMELKYQQSLRKLI